MGPPVRTRNQSPNKTRKPFADPRDSGEEQFQGPRSMDAMGALRVPDGLGDPSAAAGAREPRPARPRPAPGGRAPPGALGPGATWRCPPSQLSARGSAGPWRRPGAPRGPPAPPTALFRPPPGPPSRGGGGGSHSLEGWRGGLGVGGGCGGEARPVGRPAARPTAPGGLAPEGKAEQRAVLRAVLHLNLLHTRRGNVRQTRDGPRAPTSPAGTPSPEVEVDRRRVHRSTSTSTSTSTARSDRRDRSLTAGRGAQGRP